MTYPVDAALSTSAAPTYFPPYQHPTFGYCIDGGVYANNPGCMAIASALKSGVALSDIVMLSIGTGANPENVQVSPPPGTYGPLMWMLRTGYNGEPIPWGPMPNPFTMAGDLVWTDYTPRSDVLMDRADEATVVGRIDSANVFEDGNMLWPSG